MLKCDVTSLPVVEESPLQQTDIQFPQRLFDKKSPKNYFFNKRGTNDILWLQYDSSKDVCFCHTCIKKLRETKIQPNGNRNMLSFTSSGFYNWKDAKVAFRNHENSAVHMKSVRMLYALPRTNKNIEETLSESYTNEKKQKRKCLLKILQNVGFLARQDEFIRETRCPIGH